MADALAPPAVDRRVDSDVPTPATSAARPETPPDWSTFTADVPCPLCDYSLRGLAEPRCPECGYASNWHDLLNREKFEHPCLFEHHARRRPLRSYLKTLAGGFRPHRFWTSLDANHRAYPRRVVAYWLIGVLFTLATGFGVHYGTEAWTLWERHANVRQGMLARLAGPGGQAFAQQVTMNYGTMTKFLDLNYPVPPSKRFFQQVWGWSRVRTLPLKMTLMFLSWPLATYAVLMIFQTSMRRARVRPIHVLRCAVYSGDVAIWLGPILLLSLLVITGRGGFTYRTVAETILIAAMMLWAVATYRLVVAYHHYLRFDRPAAVVLASQLILGLAAACLLVHDFVWLLL